MRLQLLLPRLSAATAEGTLALWHKEVGDDVAYGDELCDIVVQEVTRLRRRLSARLAVGEGRASRKAKYRKLDGVTVRFRLVSAEVGQMSEIVTAPGAVVKEGDLLAVLGSGAEHEGDPPLGTARVVVNLVGSMEE